MDFLDPKKQRRHAILLYSGYILIGIAILISTVVLVYQANGYGVNNKGQVVQNGLVFLSSQPNPATVYLDGVRNKDQTNSRLSLPTGQYAVRLTRDGYRNWQRNITVQGGDVQHYDYPFLFPKDLSTKSLDTVAAPGIASQSRDKRWLVVQTAVNSSSFNLYDLKNPAQPATALSLPSALVTASTATQSWTVVQWADDNVHLLLQHTFGDSNEFIELNRSDVAKSVNLNQSLAITATSVTLRNNKSDQFYVYDAKAQELSSIDIGANAPTKLLSDVISYKSYGDNTIVYATSLLATANKVNIDMLVGAKTYIIRSVAAGTSYLLDMAGYSGTPYVVIGVASENSAYIYRDPIRQLADPTVTQPTAIRALTIPNPTYLGFSPNAQFISVEGGSRIDTYDIYQKHNYAYDLAANIDTAQQHVSWMDGDRLEYVSNNILHVADYDNANRQTLVPANANYIPFFSPDYHYVYTLAAATNGQIQLTQTALLTAGDL